MAFGLSEEQRKFQANAREWAQAEAAPHAEKVDITGEFPAETIRKAGQAGFAGMNIPHEHGGSKVDGVSYALAIQEISRACASVGVILAVHNSLGAFGVYHFGNEEQRKRYVPDLASGRKVGGFMLTEPEAGSDASNLSTTAALDGSHYVVNGKKRYILSGTNAETFVLFAMTDKTKGAKGMSALILERNTPGFKMTGRHDMMGVRGCAPAEFEFTDMRVPRENLLGKEGEGFRIALTLLDHGRIGIGAQGCGIARAALEASVKYSKTRIQFQQPISKNQGISFALADMSARTDASELLVWRAAELKDSGARFSRESATAKLFASETARIVAERAVQIHGGSGYMKGSPIERHYRDAKILEIYEGTSEVQRIVISGALLS
ncbi:MAG: acyl-CoA dehydrogenase [Euryarchaeota archaeon]|nr:acyl-CoA dehydrogenase [Euryarchaeota archaeon]